MCNHDVHLCYFELIIAVCILTGNVILVLDDLAHLMGTIESTESVLSFLDDLVTHSYKRRKRKVSGLTG